MPAVDNGAAILAMLAEMVGIVVVATSQRALATSHRRMAADQRRMARDLARVRTQIIARLVPNPPFPLTWLTSLCGF